MNLRLIDILMLLAAGAALGHFVDVIALRQFLAMSFYAEGVPLPALETLHAARGGFRQAGIVIGMFFTVVAFVRLAALVSARRKGPARG